MDIVLIRFEDSPEGVTAVQVRSPVQRRRLDRMIEEWFKTDGMKSLAEFLELAGFEIPCTEQVWL